MGSRRFWGLRRTVTRLGAAGTPDPESLEELAMEEAEEEEATAAAERLRRAREKAVRERKIRRMMEPPGPPERTLTRQAMEQIRYLSRELPEEWPVARLAQGFQVPPDVIRRVLKSRFVPSPECAKKQDATALARWGLQKESSRLETSLTREATFRVLTPPPPPPLLPQPASELPVPAVGQEKPKRQEGRRAPSSSSSQEEEEEEEEAQAGQVLSLAGLEQLAAEDWHKHRPAWVPVQRGWEFFDPEGNLLYKVPMVGHVETGKDSQ